MIIDNNKLLHKSNLQFKYKMYVKFFFNVKGNFNLFDEFLWII